MCLKSQFVAHVGLACFTCGYMTVSVAGGFNRIQRWMMIKRANESFNVQFFCRTLSTKTSEDQFAIRISSLRFFFFPLILCIGKWIKISRVYFRLTEATSAECNYQ